MARQYLKNEEGFKLTTLPDNRKLAFQVAETINLELGMEAVITKARDPQTGGPALSIYLSSGKYEITDKQLQTALNIWREYLKPEDV